ncbi:MAG: FixH family protein [Alcanivoracaceae bacterium]|jgi:hypothetical protein|nr:FixH family protein [Alcanivoracaceae bacterium]
MNHDSSARASDTKPWYRQFWPWFVIALPATAVIAGLTTLTIAIKNADDVVADNWYREGRAINRSLEAEQRARQYGIRAVLAMQPRGDWIVRLQSDTPLPWPETLELTLRHPTQADKDILAHLSHRGNGEYGTSDTLLPGDWHLVLRDTHWRLQQRVVLGDQPVEVSATL